MKRVEILWALAISAVATGILFVEILDYPLLGWDSYPQVVSARIQQASDLLGSLSEETSDGVYPYSFYRPIFNLSLAADYAVWGIDPLGYHITDALLTFFGAIAVFVLAKRLLGDGALVGRWTTLAAFLLLPVHIEMMPLISRRMDLQCGLFVTLALATQIPRLGSDRRPCALLPAALTVLAVGAKEAGVIVLPLVITLAAFHASSVDWRARLRSVFFVAAPHAAAVSLVFAARFAAIGGLGGHPSTDLVGAVTRLPWALGGVMIRLSGFVPSERGASDEAALNMVSAAVLVVLVSVIARLFVDVQSAPRDARDSEPTELEARPLRVVAIGLVWIVSCSAIYGATGLLQPWYLFMPAIGLTLIVGATAEQLVRWLRGPHGAVSAVVLALLVVWIAWQARHSPLVHDYTQWERASRAMDDYLGELTRKIESSSDGSVVSMPFPPIMIPADPNPNGTQHAPVIHVYSLKSWAELRFPERRVELRNVGLESNSKDPVADAVVVRVRGSAQKVFRASREWGWYRPEAASSTR